MNSNYTKHSCFPVFFAVAVISCILFLCLFFNSTPSSQTRQESVWQELSEKTLRLRLIANSNSAADQLTKLRVKDALISEFSSEFSTISTKEQASLWIQTHMDQISELIQKTLTEENQLQPFTCQLCQHYFPVKIYETYTIPAGIYDTLLITLGNGRGNNWWCMAFPPLCFVESCCASVPDSTNQTLQNLLSDSSYASIRGKQPLIRFRFLTFLNPPETVQSSAHPSIDSE